MIGNLFKKFIGKMRGQKQGVLVDTLLQQKPPVAVQEVPTRSSTYVKNSWHRKSKKRRAK